MLQEPNRPTPTTTTTSSRMAGLDRALPHSLDAERALLGCLLLDERNAAIAEAIAVLRTTAASAFFFDKHQRVFDLIISLYDGSRPIDGVVIKDELSRRGQFDELGGFGFLTGL